MTDEPEDDRPRRARAILAARTSTELAGGRSTAATRADQDAYVRGEISLQQLGARVRDRYAAVQGAQAGPPPLDEGMPYTS